MEQYEQQLPYLQSFSASGLGARWLKELGIELPKDPEEEEENTEEEPEEASADEETEPEKEENK